MTDKNAITEPREIAAYADVARCSYAVDAGAIRFDHPPVVERIPHGAKVRAWLPTEALREVTRTASRRESGFRSWTKT